MIGISNIAWLPILLINRLRMSPVASAHTSASQAAECPRRQPKFSLKTGTLDISTNKCFFYVVESKKNQCPLTSICNLLKIRYAVNYIDNLMRVKLKDSAHYYPYSRRGSLPVRYKLGRPFSRKCTDTSHSYQSNSLISITCCSLQYYLFS